MKKNKLPIPEGARMDFLFTKEIADDPKKLSNAYAFWKEQFQKLIEVDSPLKDNEATRFIIELKNTKLRDQFPERAYLFSEDDEKDMITKPGCLLSVHEITQHLFLDVSRKKIGLLEAIDTFEKNAAIQTQFTAKQKQEKGTYFKTRVGIAGIREIYDALRRIIYCKQVATDSDFFTMPDILALFRQEGALVVTPAKESFPYSPLIQTSEKPSCRFSTPIVSRGKVKRCGFNLSFESKNAKFFPIETTVFNLLTTGGLDAIVSPRAAINDELHQILFSATKTAQYGGYRETFNQTEFSSKLKHYIELGSPTDLNSIVFLSEGLLKVYIESNRFYKLEALFQVVANGLESLISAHSSKKEKDGRIYLYGNNNGLETIIVLKILTTWFKSRAYLYTLLAWKDREKYITTIPTFSPFVTYLRFHIGDLLFIHLLSLIIPVLGELKSIWKPLWNKAIPIKTTFEKSLDDSVWFKDKKNREEKIKKMKEISKSFKALATKKGDEREQFNWHFVGLIDILAKQKQGYPEGWKWFNDLKSSYRKDKGLEKIADEVREIVETIVQLNIAIPICLALEYTPIKVLVQKFKGYKKPFINAHSFERLRLAYKEVWQKVNPEKS